MPIPDALLVARSVSAGLGVVVLGATLALFLYASRGTGTARFGIAFAMAFVAAATWAFAPRDLASPPSPVRISEQREYVSSNACRSCHPAEYASWHDSYHRTMTQAGSASSIEAPLAAPLSFSLDGQAFGLAKRGETIWAALPDSTPRDSTDANELRPVTRRVVLTTGSHHYQAYWLEGDRPGALELFPFVYLLGKERRWIPRREVFLEPAGAPDAHERWSSNCIQCHATGARPSRASDPKGPEVAELGIACEACHGPGGAHVARYRDPVERYAAYAKSRPDTTLVNPSRLSAERASMICGSCHAFAFPRDEDAFWESGYSDSFRPGRDLRADRVLLTAEGLRRGDPEMPMLSTDVDNLFYRDGSVRIGGREYNGMILSACYLRGEAKNKISCLSCHSMHESDPDDQLAPARKGDDACAACHEKSRYATRAHTHHAEGSPGSTCLGCHMPKTTYALLKSIRSHRIDSPTWSALETSDRPNACNLCHLDRGLAWTRAALEEWSGQPSAEEPNGGETAAGARWLLSGDPAERALAAAAMGEPGAAEAMGGVDWEKPLLLEALEDPYAAVRFIAERSLGQAARTAPPRTPRHRAPVSEGTLRALVAARSPRELTLSE